MHSRIGPLDKASPSTDMDMEKSSESVVNIIDCDESESIDISTSSPDPPEPSETAADNVSELKVMTGIPIVAHGRRDSGNHSLESLELPNDNILGPNPNTQCQSRESICSIICKICHDSDDNQIDSHLIRPCDCKGTMEFVHKECLERWISESGKTTCEICGFTYNLRRQPRDTGISSIYTWLKHPLNRNDSQRFFTNILWLFFLLFSTGVTIWVSGIATSQYVNQLDPITDPDFEREINLAYGIYFLFSAIIIFLSLITVGIMTKYHYNMWKEWQNTNTLYTVLPNNRIETGNRTRRHPRHTQSDTVINMSPAPQGESVTATQTESFNVGLQISTPPLPAFFGFPKTFSLSFRVGPHRPK